MERLIMCAVTVIFSAALYADDVPDYPTRETLYPLQVDNSSSLINLTCQYDQDAEYLDCEILQVMFSKPDLEEGTDADIDEASSALNKEICDAPDVLAWGDLSLDDPAVQDKLKEASGVDVDFIMLFVEMCAEADARKRRSIFKQMIEQGNEKRRKTCTMYFLPNTDRFTWDRSTSQWRSITEGGGACGTVTVKSLQSEDGIWWRYASQTITSASQGKEPITGISCQEFGDTRALIWAAKGNAIKMNCQIIGESWTK